MTLPREEMARRKIEGEKHDPFTRRKTLPVIAQMKKEDREMTSELLQELEEKAKVGRKLGGFCIFCFLYSCTHVLFYSCTPVTL